MKISQHFEWRTHVNKDLTSCDVSCGVQGHLISLRRHLSDPAGSGCVHLILQLQDSLYQWAKGKSHVRSGGMDVRTGVHTRYDFGRVAKKYNF